jgi:hypothetical protein
MQGLDKLLWRDISTAKYIMFDEERNTILSQQEH